MTEEQEYFNCHKARELLDKGYKIGCTRYVSHIYIYKLKTEGKIYTDSGLAEVPPSRAGNVYYIYEEEQEEKQEEKQETKTKYRSLLNWREKEYEPRN